MKLCNLFLYPIKSCQGISLTKAIISPHGLRDFFQLAFYDRQFMLVDENGKFLTQRQHPLMATIQVKIEGNKLYLSSKNSSIEDFELLVEEDEKELTVNVWRDQTIAIDQGDKVANWFKKALKLKKSCRLVKQSLKFIRPINKQYTEEKILPVSFADGFPFLLTNTASLSYLNELLQAKYLTDQVLINIERFRPNIVVETSQPFIEDTWTNITIGEVYFKVVKPCSRCIVTTTDQKTGKVDRTNEPLLTLSTFRKTDEGIMFGQNMIADNQGIINIGDSLLT